MLEKLTPPSKEALCPMMREAAKLSKKDLDILLEALANPVWSALNLAKDLSELGFIVTKAQVHKHRAKLCTCAG